MNTQKLKVISWLLVMILTINVVIAAFPPGVDTVYNMEQDPGVLELEDQVGENDSFSHQITSWSDVAGINGYYWLQYALRLFRVTLIFLR